MSVRTLFAILLTLSLMLAGCGIGGDDDEPEQLSIEDAETCEDVADYFAFVAQNFIDDAESSGMQALLAGPDSELYQRYMPELEASLQKAEELGCSEEEMRPLLAERLDELETDGPVGDLIVEVLREQVISN
jgi:hypothetical protein